MIPKGCFLKVADNSGAKLAQVIGFYGKSGTWVSVGNVVKVVIKSASGDKVQKGTMKKAVITEQKFPIHRKNGSHIQYLRNSCALLTDKGQPIGSSISATLPYQFAKPRWRRLGSIGGRIY